MTTNTVVTRVGPDLHGSRMSLADFAYAEAQPGYLYELERGVIVVDVPGIPHEFVVQALRSAMDQYRLAHPGRIVLVSGAGGSVMRLPGFESERHPDVTIYLSHPPADDEQGWDEWTPDIVAEVVSKRSKRRDYQTKREEYLAAGVRQYWIVDPLARVVFVLTRRGDVWQEKKLNASKKLTSALLPGFALPLAEVFASVME